MFPTKAGDGFFDLMTASMQAQQAMWTTLSLRVPQIMTGTMTAKEQERMIAEKFEAMAESAGAASAAMNRAVVAASRGPFSPTYALNALVSVSTAASAPYHRRVVANAKRLRK